METTRTTALITGASMGIGLELARVFARSGHSLVLVARTESKLRALASELEAAYGVSVFVVPADLAALNAVPQIVQAVEERGISIDYVVNNAGFGTTGPFFDADVKKELEQIQVNVTAL